MAGFVACRSANQDDSRLEQANNRAGMQSSRRGPATFTETGRNP
jgi:hypothetical protein